MAEAQICKIDGCCKPARKVGICQGHYSRLQRHGDVAAHIPLANRAQNGAPTRWVHDNANYDGDGCLTWPFGRDNDGYGGVWVDGKQSGAHRYMCEVANGPPPTSRHEAAHSCGNGADGCVSPKHLYWATPKENKADEVAHGTRNRGEDRWSAKLTEDQVRKIRALKGKKTALAMADEFGVSRRQIYGILNGRSWAWLK